MKYFLPCNRCQNKVLVGPGQAGQSVRCNCGNMLEVPSIRAMRDLEPQAETDGTGARAAWTAKKGLIFLGLVVIGAAAGFAGYVAASRPGSIDREAVAREIASLPPAEAYRRLMAGQTKPRQALVERYKPSDPPPAYLAPSARYIASFEGTSTDYRFAPPALAGSAYQDHMKKAYEHQQIAVWIPVAAVVGIIGLLIAGSSLLIPGKRAQAASQTKPSPRRRRAKR